MRKLLYTLAGVSALALLASCNKEANFAMRENGDTVKVTFTIALPEGVATKAISDGDAATELLFKVYDQNDKHLSGLDQTVTVSNHAATVTVDLVKGVKYQYVFWAQKPNQYSLDAENATLTIAPADMMNADAWDAFYWHEPLAEVTAAFSKTITLRRPFAQINVGAPVTLNASDERVGGDFYAAGQSAILIDENLTTSYTITVPNKLNLLDDTVSGASSVEMTAAAHPTEFLTVGEVKYDYAAMAYVLAGTETDMQDLTLKLNTKQNGTPIELIRSVPNVPMRRNYRTNILGNVFTVNGNFNIVVDQNFYKVDEDYNDDYFPQYTSIEALNAAFAEGKGIGYTVEVAPAAAVSGAQTIMLPNTEDEVSIFFRGDFSDADITIVYSDVADAKKPGKLTLEAPLVEGATKSINTLTGELRATTVVLAGTTTVDTADFYTASSTLVITAKAKIVNTLTVYAGSLVVEGFIETAIIDPAVAVNTVDAVATVEEDGEVVRFVVQNLTTKIESGAKVGTLEVIADGVGATAPVTIAANATVTNIEISAENGAEAPSVVVNSEAEVNSITGDTDNVTDENGAGLCMVHNLEELNAALAEDNDTIYYDGEPITSAVTISKAVTINGLKAGSETSISSELISVKAQGVVLNNLSVKTAANYSGRIINVYDGASLTLDAADIIAPPAGSSQTRILRSENNTTVIVKNSSLVGSNNSTADNLMLEDVTDYSGYSAQGLGVGGDLVMENSSLSGFWYAVRTWNGNNPSAYTQNVSIKDSYIDGWSALYLVDEGTNCVVDGSTIVGRNFHAGETNAFGVIYMQPIQNTAGTLTLKNSTVVSAPFKNYETPVIVTSGSTVNLAGEVKFMDAVKGEYSIHGMISIGGGESVDGNNRYFAPVDGYMTLNNNADVAIDAVDGATLLYSNILVLGEKDVVVSYSESNTGYQNAANLRSAISNAADGAIVYIPEGTYKFTTSDNDRIYLNRDKKITNLTLVGLGNGAVFVHDGDTWGKSRCFYIYSSYGSSEVNTHLTMKNIRMSLQKPETNTDYVLFVRGLPGATATSFVLDLYNVECDRAIIDNGNYVADNKITFNLHSSTIKHLTVDAAPFSDVTFNTYSYVNYDTESKLGVYFQDSIKEAGLANIRINGKAPTSKEPIIIE